MTIDDLPAQLAALGPPESIFLVSTRSEARLADLVEGWKVHDFVRLVRGSRMRTLEGFFDEFAAAFQFPVYSGRNLDAFLESLSEPVQEPLTDGRVCIIWEADQFLSEEPAGDLRAIVPVLKATRANWASARAGVTSRLVPRAFSVVLVPLLQEKRVEQEWKLANARIVKLDL